MVNNVSCVAANKRLYKSFRLPSIKALNSCGRVKTTWKYGTGSKSRCCRSSQDARFVPPQLGQCRSPQEW